ncbi:MAG: hypothetical protein K8S16_02850 [Bacteroidales bacterium]|nr:hypothetical protein [Bacteroidales bacterium]
MSKLFYSEEQKFSHPWVWLVIFPSLGILIYLLNINDSDGGLTNPDNRDDIVGLIILGVAFFVMMVGLTILFYKMKLITQIKANGIYIKYPPMINKERLISKAKIKSYEIRKYHPSREYGGHGVKKGHRKAGRAYTVSGRIGLQLHLTNGEKVLIGTHRKEAIKYAMDKMISND